MNKQNLTEEQSNKLLSNYREVSDWKQIGPFCVDGRDGSVAYSNTTAQQHLFVQALGGSLLVSVINYLENGGSFSGVLSADAAKLKEQGFGCGVHRGSHANEHASDCGFADNLQNIIKRLADEADLIANLIDDVAPGVRDSTVWSVVCDKAAERSVTEVADGEQIVASSQSAGANLQTLDGDHAEIAAIVNLKAGTTFDTKAFVDGGLQAFNLDLWYVLEQARALGIDESFATHAALGLYVATEMVLVEDKKQIRLPILVNS